MKKLALFSFAALATAGLFAEVTITGVTARQRWPWNNLVDVDFDVSGAAQGEAFAISVSGTTVTPNGTATLYAKTFATEPIAKDGANRVVWDFGADYPDTKVDDLSVTVTATPYSDAMPVYLVVDISSGVDAAKWPVHYTTTAPTMTVGQEDPCKTTELWLKRVKAKGTTTKMGNIGSNKSSWLAYYAEHYCTLTNDYYLGIFPLTNGQAERMHPDARSWRWFTNEVCNATRPVDRIGIVNIHWNGTLNFPPRNAPRNEDCLLGRLEKRTGLAFTLPTEWQWEYAIRAGSTAARFPGATVRSHASGTTTTASYRNLAEEEGGTTYVDNCQPNDFGFYIAFAQIYEWCLNRWQSITYGETYTDPMGNWLGSGSDDNYKRYQVRGNNAYNAAGRTSGQEFNGGYVLGVRICLTLD